MTGTSSIRIITWISGVILFSFLLFIAICNRISIDDMFYYARCRDVGINNMVAEQFYGYSGRFMAYYVNGFVLSYFSYPMLVIWNMVSIGVFFLAFYLFYQSVKWLPEISKSAWVILFGALVLGSSGPGDQFFWYTQVNTYLWSYTCLLFILYILHKPECKTQYGILLILCCAFLGGASESVALQLLFITGVWAVRGYMKSSTRKKIFLALGILVLLAEGYTNAFSEGNQIRSEIIQRLNSTGFIKAMAASVYYYYVSPSSAERLLWLLPLTLIIALMGYPSKTPFNILQITIGYALFMACFLAPTAWALREQAPARALIGCDLLTTLFLLLFFNKLISSRFSPVILQSLATVILAGAAFFYGQQSMKYSNAYDLRENIIKNWSTHTTVKIEPLPYVRMLKGANGHSDSLHYSNYHIQLYYGLKHRVHE